MKSDASKVGTAGGGEFGSKVFVGIDAKTGYCFGMAGTGRARRGLGGRRRRILGRKGQVAHGYHLMWLH